MERLKREKKYLEIMFQENGEDAVVGGLLLLYLQHFGLIRIDEIKCEMKEEIFKGVERQVSDGRRRLR